MSSFQVIVITLIFLATQLFATNTTHPRRWPWRVGRACMCALCGCIGSDASSHDQDRPNNHTTTNNSNKSYNLPHVKRTSLYARRSVPKPVHLSDLVDANAFGKAISSSLSPDEFEPSEQPTAIKHGFTDSTTSGWRPIATDSSMSDQFMNRLHTSCQVIVSMLPVQNTFSESTLSEKGMTSFLVSKCLERFINLYFMNGNLDKNNTSSKENLMVFNVHETVVSKKEGMSMLMVSKLAISLFRRMNEQELHVNLVGDAMITYRSKFIHFLWKHRDRFDFALYEEELDRDSVYYHVVTVELFYNYILYPLRLESKSFNSTSFGDFKFKFIYHCPAMVALRAHAAQSLFKLMVTKTQRMYQHVFVMLNSDMLWHPRCNSADFFMDPAQIKKFTKNVTSQEDDWFAELSKFITQIAYNEQSVHVISTNSQRSISELSKPLQLTPLWEGNGTGRESERTVARTGTRSSDRTSSRTGTRNSDRTSSLFSA